MTQQISGNALKGIGLIVAAVFIFALQDNLVKLLTASHPIALVMALRYAVNMLLLLAVFGYRSGTAMFRTTKTGLVILRGVCLAAGSFFMALALQRMPVAETVAIIYLQPFLVMIAAIPLLGEKVKPIGWIAAALGFIGVLLIARPGGGLDTLGVVYALLCAAVSVVYHLLTRSLAATETMEAMLLYTAATGTVLFGAALPFIPLGGGFSAIDSGFMLSLGVLATFGHFLFTAAYREAPASLLAPVNYLHLAFAALLGWIIFGHVPAHWSLVGMAMVLIAGWLWACTRIGSGGRRSCSPLPFGRGEQSAPTPSISP